MRSREMREPSKWASEGAVASTWNHKFKPGDKSLAIQSSKEAGVVAEKRMRVRVGCGETQGDVGRCRGMRENVRGWEDVVVLREMPENVGGDVAGHQVDTGRMQGLRHDNKIGGRVYEPFCDFNF